MKPYVVSIVRDEDVSRQVQQAIALIGGMEKYVQPGGRVLIKPNMTGPAPYTKGVTTNPAVVEELARMAFAAGAGSVDIGDGTGSVHIGSVKVMELCGMGEVAERTGCGLVDLNKGATVKISVENGEILDYVQVNRHYLEAYDTVINVPVLKTHFITQVSLGMKNMKGVIPPAEKRRFHDVGVSQAVADLNCVVKTTLTVMDGTVAGEGLGPKEGKAVGFHTVLAGENILAVDMVSTAVMGFDPMEIDHIRMVAQHGMGPASLDEIQVEGMTIDEAKRPFLPAMPKMPDSDQAEVVNFESCSGCMGAAAIAISRLDDMGFFRDNPDKKIVLVIGTKVPKDFKLEPGVFLVGNCAAGKCPAANRLIGCAPSALDVANGVLDYYGIENRPYV